MNRDFIPQSFDRDSQRELIVQKLCVSERPMPAACITNRFVNPSAHANGSPVGSRSDQSSMFSLISSEFAFSSGEYIASARVGNALNLPGISALSR